MLLQSIEETQYLLKTMAKGVNVLDEMKIKSHFNKNNKEFTRYII